MVMIKTGGRFGNHLKEAPASCGVVNIHAWSQNATGLQYTQNLGINPPCLLKEQLRFNVEVLDSGVDREREISPKTKQAGAAAMPRAQAICAHAYLSQVVDGGQGQLDPVTLVVCGDHDRHKSFANMTLAIRGQPRPDLRSLQPPSRSRVSVRAQ